MIIRIPNSDLNVFVLYTLQYAIRNQKFPAVDISTSLIDKYYDSLTSHTKKLILEELNEKVSENVQWQRVRQKIMNENLI